MFARGRRTSDGHPRGHSSGRQPRGLGGICLSTQTRCCVSSRSMRRPFIRGLHLAYAVDAVHHAFLACSVVLSWCTSSSSGIGQQRTRAVAGISRPARTPGSLPHRRRAASPDEARAERRPYWLTISGPRPFHGMPSLAPSAAGRPALHVSVCASTLGYRSADTDKRMGGLVLEVKGDFCHQVRRILAGHGRRTTMSRSASRGRGATTRCTRLGLRTRSRTGLRPC